MKILLRVLCAISLMIGSILLMYGCIKTVRSEEAKEKPVDLGGGITELGDNSQEKQMAKIGFVGGAFFLVLGGSLLLLSSKKGGSPRN